jgi:hypothetical protein
MAPLKITRILLILLEVGQGGDGPCPASGHFDPSGRGCYHSWQTEASSWSEEKNQAAIEASEWRRR